jgi:hypothetical protein
MQGSACSTGQDKNDLKQLVASGLVLLPVEGVGEIGRV